MPLLLALQLLGSEKIPNWGTAPIAAKPRSSESTGSRPSSPRALLSWLAASALAASQDSSARGLLGLDPVDSDDLGLAAIGAVPQFGIFSEPSSCNASSNGTAWYQSGEALRVTDANHCDFEGPTDQLCTLVCASGSASPDPLRREVVWALSTAAVLGLNGDEQILADWWMSGGERYDAFAADGRISAL